MSKKQGRHVPSPFHRRNSHQTVHTRRPGTSVGHNQSSSSRPNMIETGSATATSSTSTSTSTNQSASMVHTPPSLQTLLDELKRNGRKLSQIEQDCTDMKKELSILKTKVEKNERETFKIEKSPYQGTLDKEIGQLFVTTLSREPTSDGIGDLIADVLKNEAADSHKRKVAKSYCSSRLTHARCEERRRIFGHHPCQNFKSLSTKDLAARLICTLKAPEACTEVYTCNLAILRKFCRENYPQSQYNTYQSFREWLKSNYDGNPAQDENEIILSEDIAYDYSDPNQFIMDYVEEDDERSGHGDELEDSEIQ